MYFLYNDCNFDLLLHPWGEEKMKQFMSLIAIAVISSASFAGSSSSNSAALLGAAWKHQAPVSIGNHNLTMVGGQDISNKSVIEAPITTA